MKIEIKVEYKKEYELERLANICCNISDNFFQTRRFILSDTLIPNLDSVIYLPNFEIKDSKKFWEMMKKEKYSKEIENLINTENIQSLSDKKVGTIEKRINKDIKELERNINSIFGQLKYKKLIVIVRPTIYGSCCSFTKPMVKSNNIYIDYIWLRTDMPTYSLVEAIVSSLVFFLSKQKNWHSENWKSYEMIVDFFLTNTSISKNTKGFKGTINSLNMANNTYGDLVSSSKEYYKRLGFPIKSMLKIKNGNIFNENIPIRNLNNFEEKTLRYLIENKERVCTFEEIGDVIWDSNDEKYSQWAITKLIQRIREKLKENNIQFEILQTVKRVGYVLYD